MEPKSKKHIVKSALFVSFATALSRIAGYIRDLALAIVLGGGYSMDAFTVGFRIANFFRSLVGEGSMNACFVPVFVHYQKDHAPPELWDFVRKFLYSFLLLLVALSLIIFIFSPFLIRLLAPGFGSVEGKEALTVFLNRMMAPYLISIGLSALFIGILNALDVFFLPASTSTFFNLTLIASAVLAAPLFREHSVGIAIGVLVGGLLQWTTLIPPLIKRGMNFRPTSRLRHPETGQVIRLLLPILFGISITQINLLIGSVFASFLDQGSVSSLYYSDRVMELMLGVFAISFATVLLPEFSRAARDGNLEHGSSTLGMTLRLTFFIAVPATVGLIVLNREIIFTLFQYGRFSAEDGARTAYTLMFLGLGLVFFSAIKIVIPAFYAFKDTRTPVVGSCLALAANLFFILILIKPLRIGGIALANSLAALINLIFLSWQLNRKYFKIPYREVLPSLYKICAASLVMGAGCFATSRLMGFRADGSLWGRIFPLAVTILAGIAIYLLVSVLLKSREIREAKEVFARKLITVPPTKGTGLS